MSLPTNEEGYAGALYVFVRLLFLSYKSTEMSNAQRMTVPSTAPTTAATGTECAWRADADADAFALGVAMVDRLCVIVLSEGSAKLNVKSGSRDGLSVVEDVVKAVVKDVVAVTVIIKTDVIGVSDDTYEATHGQLPRTCDRLCGLTSPWSTVLVRRTGTTWHTWIHRTATTETIAHVEHTSMRTVIDSS
jgi:hypothetical protein